MENNTVKITGKIMETPEQIISKCVNNIVREIASWKYIQKYGCNDPFWPDGCNMNITRNHIISYKHDIREICEANNMPLPEDITCQRHRKLITTTWRA